VQFVNDGKMCVAAVLGLGVGGDHPQKRSVLLADE
jgi:hypothetical protein